MNVRTIITGVFLALSLTLLSACESSEKRAEKHFQSAIALLEAGDEERAIVEFKNVFKFNTKHEQARMSYAALQRKRGNLREAIGQYLRLVEQFPKNIEGQRAIAEMYAEIGNWPEMERFLNAARALDDEDVGLNALQQVFDYRQAIQNNDEEAAQQAFEQAQFLSKLLPGNITLRRLIVDNFVRTENYAAALKELDLAIKIQPENHDLHAAKLSVLAALQDPFAIEAQLKEMIAKFPDDETSRATLVRWYVSQDQLDEAEAYLRGAVGSGETEDMLTLLRFLAELRGQDVALNELNSIIDAGHAPVLLYGLRAGYEFDAGNRETAINQLKALLERSEPSEETRTTKIALSKMLLVTGDVQGARALVEEVLSEDEIHTDAIKIKAGWLIADDQVGDAIVLLRTALNQNKQDADVLTILARAHERDGNQVLVGEMLALAVDASEKAPTESVRYASFLVGQGKLDPAESVLVSALRLAPNSAEILIELGKIYVQTQDWPRAEQVLSTLQNYDYTQASNELQTLILLAQNKTSETVAFLESLLDAGEIGVGANIAIVRSYLSDGETDKAKAHIASVLSEDPENLALLFIDAAIDAGIGDIESGERKYRALLAKEPHQTQVWVALFRLLSEAGESENAAQVISDAQKVLPNDSTLKWIEAGLKESAHDLEGAIAIYEELYAIDSENLVIANNLASLLTTARDDEASLERANIIARRLRPSQVAPYQDTYGWIAYLRGETKEAIRSLEPAAATLTSDPLVQFHLAKAYLKSEQNVKALAQFKVVLALTGPADSRDFVMESRTEVSRLQALQSAADEN